MITLLKDLFFDREMVGKIRESKLNKNILYNHLCNGRITLQEYLSAEKKTKIKDCVS